MIEIIPRGKKVIISLFDGGACGMEVIRQLGLSDIVYFASEINDTAKKIALKNHPNIIQVGDIRVIRYLDGILYTQFGNYDVGDIYALIGGSPCQGFSRNGNGLNFEHKESRLYFEFERIYKEMNPKYVMLENVSMAAKWQNVITERLNLPVYKIDSRHYSAGVRLRTYWTNIEFNDCKSNSVNLIEVLNQSVSYLTHPELYKLNKSEKALIYAKRHKCVYVQNNTNQGWLKAEYGDCVNLTFPTSTTRRGRVVKSKSATIDRQANLMVWTKQGLRRLHINELERINGLPDGYTDGFALRERKEMIGNGWNIQTIKRFFVNLK